MNNTVILSSLPYEYEAGLPEDIRLILARVRLRLQRRTSWLACLEAEEAEVIHLHHTFALRDSPQAEREWQETQAHFLNQQIQQVDEQLQQLTPLTSRWKQLQDQFHLSSKDLDVLQVCFASLVEPALWQEYSALPEQSQRPYVTEPLIARLFGYGHCLLWPTDSPLRTYRIIQEYPLDTWGSPALLCSTHIRDWLLQHDTLPASLVGIASQVAIHSPLSHWPVIETVTRLERLAQQEPVTPVCLQIVGYPGSGRRTFAACVSELLGYSLLQINTSHLDGEEWHRVFVDAQREAWLNHRALLWHGSTLQQRPWSFAIRPFPVQFIISQPGEAPYALPGMAHEWVELAPPSMDERNKLWTQLAAQTHHWSAQQVTALSSRFRVNVGDVVHVAQSKVQTPEEAARLLQIGQRNRFGPLAQQLTCPFHWDDLVISSTTRDTLQDLVYEAKERTTFWEQPTVQRLFPRGQGLVALFSGPPGTGKTMAAQIIAAELGLELFRIDLSAVVSKYVGETSKNLERILSQAEHMDIVLLFDEADTLFGKRTDVRNAHDRFANTDTNYLLQAIESYSGIALLATNKKEHLEPAMMRRMRYILDFPTPTEQQRRHIWDKLVTAFAGEQHAQSMRASLALLAREVQLSGAQIKSAILHAMFIARRNQANLNPKYIFQGLQRELAKDGRSFSERQNTTFLQQFQTLMPGE